MSEGFKKNVKSFTPYRARPSEIGSVDASIDPMRQVRLRVQNSLDLQVQQLSTDQPFSTNLFINPQYTTFDISQRVSLDGNIDFMFNNLIGTFVNSSLDSKLIQKPLDIFQSQNRQINPTLSSFFNSPRQSIYPFLQQSQQNEMPRHSNNSLDKQIKITQINSPSQFIIRPPSIQQQQINVNLNHFKKEELKLLNQDDSDQSEVVQSESSWNQNKDEKKEIKINRRTRKRCIIQESSESYKIGRKKKGSKVNDTKNITKNFSKAIISYILNNEQMIQGFMKKDQYDNFVQLLKTKKNQMTNIKQLRDLWIDGEFLELQVNISQEINLQLMYIIQEFLILLGIQNIDKIFQGPLRSLKILNSSKLYDQIHLKQNDFPIKQFCYDFNQFFIASIMKKEDYRIILQYSQLTLNRLTAPYYHENKGCQFNLFELDKPTQAALEQDESKQFTCPVCHLKGKLKLDILYCQNEFVNEKNQLVVNQSNQQILKIQKQNYTHSFLSKEQEVLELQQQFNSQILLNVKFQNQLTLQYIEKINQDRNNEIFQIFRRNSQLNLPTLIGIINFKLILFYHISKTKLEFDLYDDTNKKNCIKIHDYQTSGNIRIKQVDLIDNYIYIIIQQESFFQLYRGRYNQIFNEDRNEAIFYVSQMPGYTLLGESRLLQFKKQKSIMIGNKGSIIVKDIIDNNVVMNQNLRIPELNENSQLVQLLDSQILFVDQNIMAEVGVIKEYNYSEQKIIKIIQNNIFNQIFENDLPIVHNQVLYLLNSERLNNQNIQVQYIMPGRENNCFTKTIQILNHNSYMKVKIIPTTQTQVGIVSSYMRNIIQYQLIRFAMPLKAFMFGIILISALVLAQTNVELSEIETNPIPTMVNFDGYQRNEDQIQQQQEYFNFDDTFTSSNTQVIQNIENNQSVEDPNNFILDQEDVSTLNSQITTMTNNQNYIQDVNDIPQLDMIHTQSTQTINQQDSTNISETQSKNTNSNCIVIYSQCHFKGESLQLCESQRNIDDFDHDIKSIEIPKGYSVRLYNKEDFSGEKIVLKESQECLIKPLALTQLKEKQWNKFTILAQNINLRAI
ncbi:unnamed protein product [Paramecium sonneborni]|uniref:Beta/gamma crystallin 'Greek key' domain-containing protein n=1 Tax=Paramecium sonneborni TaxID=65129 RepID=A0A8S1Q7W2_9CILI|nr:unnamed protein product [Paramecium sonneborni]